MKFLASIPELCDVTFLVGDTREPVCGVRAVMAARSRYDYQKTKNPSPNLKKRFQEHLKETLFFYLNKVSIDM
jgi:hypothetical protein